MSDLDVWAGENGYVVAVAMPGDRVAFVVVTVMGQGQIGVGDRGSVFERFTFQAPLFAEVALRDWQARSFKGEPIGWHRHQPSDRRRPDGDPEQEYVAP